MLYEPLSCVEIKRIHLFHFLLCVSNVKGQVEINPFCYSNKFYLMLLITLLILQAEADSGTMGGLFNISIL